MTTMITTTDLTTENTSGIIIFKNFRLNDRLSVVFSNKIFGFCAICFNDVTRLTHYQTCGHAICIKCTNLIHNSSCVVCRHNNLIPV